MHDAPTATTTSPARPLPTVAFMALRNAPYAVMPVQVADGLWMVGYNATDPDVDHTFAADVMRLMIGEFLDATIAAAPTPEDRHAADLARVRALVAAEVAGRPGARTVDLAVWGGNTLTVIEPSWCTREHATEGRGEHPEDIHHCSTEATAKVTRADSAKETLLSGWIVVNPYLQRMPEVRAAVALATGDVEEYDAAGLACLADEIRAAAAFIDGLHAQLTNAIEEAGR